MKTLNNSSVAAERGQGLTEYLILTGLIAVSAIAVVSIVGKNLREQYANISRAITKQDGASVKFTQVDEEAVRERGMADFMTNARAGRK